MLSDISNVVDKLAERKREVPSDFNIVSSTYDKSVKRNPGYVDHLKLSASRLELANGGEGLRILDLCCGTGLSTEALLAVYPKAEIVGIDASSGMLDVANAKTWPSTISFVLGDAMDPRASGITGDFDAIMMAYGIRNMPDQDKCLKQMANISKPGAAVVFHEYSVADSLKSRIIWTIVSWGIIVPNGFITARHTRIYRYLWRTVLHFDGVKRFETRLRDSGFVNVCTKPMHGWQRGIVHSFLAQNRQADAL